MPGGVAPLRATQQGPTGRAALSLAARASPRRIRRHRSRPRAPRRPRRLAWPRRGSCTLRPRRSPLRPRPHRSSRPRPPKSRSWARTSPPRAPRALRTTGTPSRGTATRPTSASPGASWRGRRGKSAGPGAPSRLRTGCPAGRSTGSSSCAIRPQTSSRRTCSRCGHAARNCVARCSLGRHQVRYPRAALRVAWTAHGPSPPGPWPLAEPGGRHAAGSGPGGVAAQRGHPVVAPAAAGGPGGRSGHPGRQRRDGRERAVGSVWRGRRHRAAEGRGGGGGPGAAGERTSSTSAARIGFRRRCRRRSRAADERAGRCHDELPCRARGPLVRPARLDGGAGLRAPRHARHAQVPLPSFTGERAQRAPQCRPS